MKKTVSVLFALFLALGLCLVMALPAYAVHALTPGASVDIDADTNGGAYTALNAISFTDPGPDLAATNTFYLTAPADFEFNTAAAADQAVGAGYATTQIDLGAGAGNPQAPAYSGVGGNTVATWTVTAPGVGLGGVITISGMELRPTAAKTTIVGDGTAMITIAGNVTTFDSPNAHPIDHVPGALNNFLVEAQGGGAIGPQIVGTAFLIQITARDQYNNTLNDGVNNFNGAGNTVDITSNVTISAGGGVSPAFTNGVLNNHSMTLGQAHAAATITATDSAGGLGTGVETGTSNAFVVTVATANFMPSSAPAGTIIVVTGAGWIASDNITGVTVGGFAASQTLTVDGAGALSGNIVIPAQATGVKNVVITGAASGAQTFTNAFTVTVFGGGGGGAPASSASGVGSLNLASYLDLQGKATANISLTSTDSLVIMNIPWGTRMLDAQGNPLGSIEINMLSTPPPPPGYVLVGHAYDCLPAGATFEPAMTLTFKYAQADVPDEANEQDLVLAYWDGEEWVNLSTTVNATANTATAKVAHFTPFAILAYIGAPVFGTSDLAITPVEVNIGEEVTISLLVANTGDKAGSYEVTLEIDNVAVTTEAVNLVAGASEGVNFTTAEDVAGTYTVSVGGLSGTFVVKAAPAAFSLSKLSIQPAEVQPGEAVTITVSVVNTGGTEGSYPLVLAINGVEEENKIVTVAPGGNHDATLTVTKEEAGIYNVSVGGLSGSFTVTKPLNIWLIIGIIVAVAVVVLVAVILGRGRRRA